MKRLLNFGVSDPLTLGMAHPVADRLETLGRARPVTWGSRCLALSAMSVIALASAPLSIASDHPDHDSETHVKTRYKFISSFDGKKGQSYEIVTEDGVKKAYRLLGDGKRKEVDLTKNSDGSYQMSYDDGQIIDLPNIDLDGLEGLKGLAELEKLEGLKGLKALKSLEGLEGLSALSALKGLDGLDGLDALDGIEISGEDVQILTLDGTEFTFSDDSNLRDGFPEKLRAMLSSKDGSKTIKIVRNGETANWISKNGSDGERFDLEDTVVGTHFEFIHSSNRIDAVQRQLDRTKRHLEAMKNNKDISYDLESALRDIESAQKSLEEAESRLLDDDE
ncbi:MAG: hypothetical protein ABJO36_07480 [Litorimonas sp.]